MKPHSAFLLFLFGVSYFGISGVRAEESLPPLPKGPLILTSAKSSMMNPDYWIQQIPDAEKMIKTPAQLKEFNHYIAELIAERIDIFKLSKTRNQAEIQDNVLKIFKALRARKLYDVKNQTIARSFFNDEILPKLNTTDKPQQIKVRWGACIRSTLVRALPSDTVLLEKPNDVEFDQLQFARIKLWTPVAILHESKEGDWYFIQAPYARGWVKSRDIALFAARDDLKKWIATKSFITVTGDYVKLWKDPKFKTAHVNASMGTVIPLRKQTDEGFFVWVPMRKKDGTVSLHQAYLKKNSDVSVGFLPYTQANIIRQAFKLLAKRYGWGGTYEGRDCSGFIHDVFLSLGVDMPRNSQDQAFVGTKLGFFHPFSDEALKKQTLDEARPGLTLLAMHMHMMIYLGKENDNYYVIHSTWAERISKTSDQKNRINQVVVTDLNLNGKSYLGSLFDRIISMNEVD